MLYGVMAVLAFHAIDELTGRGPERRWAAGCNALTLTAARLTWLGDHPNRIGWVEDSVRRST